jgi:hypothetical protein
VKARHVITWVFIHSTFPPIVLEDVVKAIRAPLAFTLAVAVLAVLVSLNPLTDCKTWN